MTDLGLEILRTTGRRTQDVLVDVVRDLVPEDLKALDGEAGVKPSPLKKLQTRHHALARALASGMSDGDAAILVGLDQSRVSILKSDPAFRELMIFYREDVDRIWRDTHESLADMSYDAIEMIRDRMEAEPEKITTNQLMEIVKLGADRSGHGPSSSQTTTNVNINLASNLEAARKRVAEQRLRLINGGKDGSGHNEA